MPSKILKKNKAPQPKTPKPKKPKAPPKPKKSKKSKISPNPIKKAVFVPPVSISRPIMLSGNESSGSGALSKQLDIISSKELQLESKLSDFKLEFENKNKEIKALEDLNAITMLSGEVDDLRNNLGFNYSNATLRGLIRVEGVNETAIINLSVESVDPVLATDIANELVIIIKDLSTEFVGLENVEVLYPAVTPTAPSGPNRVLYIIVGGLLGGIIGVGLVLGIEFLDKNIKNTKDVENILNLRVLGSIPEYYMEEVE